ncbi:hypothetical protein XA3_10520 [Xylocopilactobacillus apicola]|uniref:Transposase n=1 Tax=Xylocopilactobacillus apicola TaxID=2932184 RepID=A0AAU9D1M3_9LACO|nr:hypothetical protein XA3_10520 [Xylocopilactobacillus apicola]
MLAFAEMRIVFVLDPISQGTIFIVTADRLAKDLIYVNFHKVPQRRVIKKFISGTGKPRE